jgi:hypothetical protein
MSGNNVLIKDLWDELAVKDDYKKSFKDFKKFHQLKTEKKFYQDYEKQHLLTFKAFLKTLKNQLKTHSNLIKKLKKYDENIDIIFDDNNDKFLFNFVNEIIECIKNIRENSTNIIKLFIQIKGNDKKHNLEKIDKKYFNSQKIYKIFNELDYYKQMKILKYFDINPDFILSDKQSETKDKIKIPMEKNEIENYNKLVPLFYDSANDLYNKEHPSKKNGKKNKLTLQQKLQNLKDDLGEEEYNKLFFIHYLPPHQLLSTLKFREKMIKKYNKDENKNNVEENEEEEEESSDEISEEKEDELFSKNNKSQNDSEYSEFNFLANENILQSIIGSLLITSLNSGTILYAMNII